MTVLNRPHWGSRAENALMHRIAGVLRRFGWRPLVVPYTGYGSAPDAETGEGWVRVLMRVKLGPRQTSTEAFDGGRCGGSSSPSGCPTCRCRCAWVTGFIR